MIELLLIITMIKAIQAFNGFLVSPISLGFFDWPAVNAFNLLDKWPFYWFQAFILLFPDIKVRRSSGFPRFMDIGEMPRFNLEGELQYCFR